MDERTVGVALCDAAARIAPVSESAAGDARRLMSHVLGVEAAWLLAHGDAPLTDAVAARFESLVARAASGEPLPYILGSWPFYDREFTVTPDVLIPRPETELLVEAALDFIGDRPLTVVDVGTGSGAIAVMVAALRPRTMVYGVDVSVPALLVASGNGARHKVRLSLLPGDLLIPLIGHHITPDVVLANLPYIPSEVVDGLTVARHEPRLALDGGADGLDLVRRLLLQAATFDPAPTLFLEIMSGQGEAVRALAGAILPGARVTVTPDYAGHDRVVRLDPGK